MGVTLSVKARKDMLTVYLTGITTFGEKQSELYQDKIEAAFILLSENPRAARLRSEVRPPVRAYPCGAHVVIYEIDDADDILILRMHHSREDWLDL
jgi:toxin ParE1/3/4